MTLTEKIELYSITLVKGAGWTVSITLLTFCIAVILGLIFGAVKAFGGRQTYSSTFTLKETLSYVLARIAVIVINVYVEIFRGLPALAVLFILYFGLANVGIRLEPFTAAVMGLGLIGGAMLTEVFRAGFGAIHAGQREAALAVGMTPFGALMHIILPQTWRVTLPPLANYAIGLLKDTAIVSAIAAPEIMFFARNLVTRTFDTEIIYILVAIIYFCLSFPLARLADRFEAKAKAGAR
ncbi:MAG: amino acid ABC transporter permease [Rhodobacteraceae bacterium]|nr:amino acid ABC transporter permease [Paracoccaceae bacterium]